MAAVAAGSMLLLPLKCAVLKLSKFMDLYVACLRIWLHPAGWLVSWLEACADVVKQVSWSIRMLGV